MNFDAIARYMEDVICEKHGLPGCDLTVMREHEVLYRHTCGYADREAGRPTDPNALYYMYSCTKPMTVTAAMRLIEDGKMGLDDPVARYLPEFREMQVKEGDTLRPAKGVMTLRHLFTMTGGLDYTLYSPDINELLEKAENRASTREIIARFATRPLFFEPGERYQYSLCHDVLAAVIAEASGMPYADYMQKVIFDPLGMENSSFFDTPEVRERIAPLYRAQDGNAEPTEKKNVYHISTRYESGGAGLICSLGDYIKFADTLASGGRTADDYHLLSRASIDLLRTEQLTKFTKDSSFGCGAGEGYGYALGVRTRTSVATGRGSLGEFGWDGAAGSYVLIDPEEKISIFFASHLLNWPNMILGDHSVLRDLTYEVLGL